MNKKEKTALLPKLRFPEFVDSGVWSISKLGNISEPIEKRAGTKKYTLLSVTAGTGLVSQLEKFGREIAGNAYKNYYVIQQGDFAYNKSATKQFPEGYISMLTEYEEGAVPNSIFTCFSIIDNQYCPKIFDHIFKSNFHGIWLRKFISVGARAHGSLSIDDKYLWEMPIVLPALPEQQKIADCLSSLDDLITAEDKKLSALKAHKKGLMQKLFPAEGKTVPAWRFPEFRDSGEWVRNKLGDIGEIITGSTPLTSKKEYYDGDFSFVSPADISDKRYIDFTRTTLTEVGFNQTRHVVEDSILFVCIGSTIGKIAQNKEICATNQQINSIIPFDNLVNGYIYYELDFLAKSVAKLAGKQAVPIINKTLFSSVLIDIPVDPQEQQKIADCLSSLDNIITAQAEKIEALKVHKKGLMQGLFPSIEEVEA